MSNREIQMIGNAALLELPGKVALLSSRRVTPTAVMRCYDWATEVRGGAAGEGFWQCCRDRERHGSVDVAWRK